LARITDNVEMKNLRATMEAQKADLENTRKSLADESRRVKQIEANSDAQHQPMPIISRPSSLILIAVSTLFLAGCASAPPVEVARDLPPAPERLMKKVDVAPLDAACHFPSTASKAARGKIRTRCFALPQAA
jgi:hypothetical protein